MGENLDELKELLSLLCILKLNNFFAPSFDHCKLALVKVCMQDSSKCSFHLIELPDSVIDLHSRILPSRFGSFHNQDTRKEMIFYASTFILASDY